MESDLLGHIPLFAPLSVEERGELTGLMKAKRFSPGEHIVWVGEPGVEFFIIQQGRVAITLPDENGRELVLATLTAGQFFGEISLLDGGPRTATARAETEAELLELGRNDFLEFVRKHPSAAIHMMTVLGQRQRETNDKLRGIQNANEVIAEKRTTSERVAERVATMFASSGFVTGNLVMFAFWIVANLLLARSHRQFDDPPTFATLGFIITLEAMLLTLFVLASQKLQGIRDRIRSDLEYQVNVKAQLEIVQLHQKIDRMETMLESLTGGSNAEAKVGGVRPT
jgi:CRP/FNR family cyclic AMP-dependent transcriptional regulator